MNCRICGSENYKSILDLGSIYPSNFISNGPGVEPKPLHLVKCVDCDLVQLRETFDLDIMYKEHYWYRSGLNVSMVESLKDVVDKALEAYTVMNNESPKYALDIGCNDGTLLSHYPNTLLKVGVDPSINVKESAEKHCDLFINDYFNLSNEQSLYPYLKYDIITSIAMFYDLENPNKFVRDIKELLADNGLWIIQFTDLLSMAKLSALDNICHEHLEYYSLNVLNTFLENNGLQIINIEYNKVNGGSVRAYVTWMGKTFSRNSLLEALENERRYFEMNPIENFNIKILEQKSNLLSLITSIKKEGWSIYVLGASTKGNTLLQHYGLDSTIIDKALEINEDKWGLQTIGTKIPIISEIEGMKDRPDFLLILPWAFTDFFITKFDSYIKAGGKLIVPLPEVRVIE